MSEFKGTKGDWEVTEQLTNNGSFFRIKGESEKVANVVTRDFERAEANAKLIACAPEMLEFLNRINEACRLTIDDSIELDQLIKKATE